MKRQLLIDYINAVQETAKALDKLSSVTPELATIADNTYSSQLLWSDYTVRYLLNNSDTAADYFFTEVYCSPVFNTESVVDRALQLSTS